MVVSLVCGFLANGPVRHVAVLLPVSGPAIPYPIAISVKCGHSSTGSVAGSHDVFSLFKPNVETHPQTGDADAG